MKSTKYLLFLLVPILLLTGCQPRSNSTTKDSSSQSSTAKQTKTSSKQATGKTNANATAPTALAQVPLAGIWHNDDGVTFTFDNQGKWSYETGTDAKISGTYQLAGVVGRDVLLKLHGLDQDIGSIGNYLWLTFAKDKQTIDLAGFGKFQLKDSALDLSAEIRMPHAFTAKPQALKELLVGTWMNTDENAVNAITMNFDPNGSYQRYLSANGQVEQGTYRVSQSHNATNQVQIKLLTSAGQEKILKFTKNGDLSQLTSVDDPATTYVKNLVPQSAN